MSPINIDFTGSSSSFEPIPDGTYDAEIVECKLSDKAGQSGYHYVTFTFGKIEGQSDARKLWRNYSLSPNALWALKGLLDLIGMDVPDGEFEFEPDDTIGSKVGLVVITKPHYRDPSRMDNEVADVVAPSGNAAHSWS